MSRRAARIDANHLQIVLALRAAGAVVYSLAEVGRGVPDALIGYRHQTLLMEFKDGHKPPSARALTPAQRIFHETWIGGPLSIVDGPDAALRALGVLKGSQ